MGAGKPFFFDTKRDDSRFAFQRPPYAETKLIYVAQGKIFIVLVDLRAGSATFGRWDSVDLSIETPEFLYVPKGIAMGMCTLTDHCSLLYKMDAPYNKGSSRTIRWNDPDLNIPWPIDEELITSEKDSVAPLLKEYLAKDGAVIV